MITVMLSSVIYAKSYVYNSILGHLVVGDSTGGGLHKPELVTATVLQDTASNKFAGTPRRSWHHLGVQILNLVLCLGLRATLTN